MAKKVYARTRALFPPHPSALALRVLSTLTTRTSWTSPVRSIGRFHNANAVARACVAYDCIDAGMWSTLSSMSQCGNAAPTVSTSTFHPTLIATSNNHGRQRDRGADESVRLAVMRENRRRLISMNNAPRSATATGHMWA